MKSRFDFTKDELRPKILKLAVLNGYEKPSTYLNELLSDVEHFNDSEFKFDFYINICHLCSENSDSFWDEGHKKDITNWLKKFHIITTLFDRMWDIKEVLPVSANKKQSLKEDASTISEIIDSKMISIVEKYEANIEKKVAEWRNGKDKKGCAAFCVYLFEVKYFYTPNLLQTAKKFAASRYQNNFDSAIDMFQKIRNKTREKDLEAIKRLILKQPYGKL